MCLDVNEHLQTKYYGAAVPDLVQENDLRNDQNIAVECDDELENDLEGFTFGELIPDPEEERPKDNGNAANRPVENSHWSCPVCTSLLPHTIPLRDHLKEHYSEEVSGR